MMKYSIPAMKIKSFSAEKIVTGASGYIQDIQNMTGAMGEGQQYQTMKTDVNDLLQYN